MSKAAGKAAFREGTMGKSQTVGHTPDKAMVEERRRVLSRIESSDPPGEIPFDVNRELSARECRSEPR
jgi:hypothetical protein